MSTVRQIARFLEKEIREGRGDWQVAICRRGFSVRPNMELHPSDPHEAVDAVHKLVFLTARIKEK